MNKKYDVIVVGASNAGGFAAAAAAENGQDVLVVEKTSTTTNLYRHWLGGINTNAQKRAGVKINENDLMQYITLFTQDHIDQRLLKTWIKNSGETLNWLEDNILKKHGCHLYSEQDAAYETLINTAFPTEHHVTKDDHSDDKNYGDYVLEYAQNQGAEIKYKTKLQHLLISDRKEVIGIEAENLITGEIEQYYARKGVILATGGYGANTSLVEKWNPSILKVCDYTQSPRDDGTGIQAALDIGAKRDDEPASIIFDRGCVPVGTNWKTKYEITWKNHQYNIGSFPFLKVNLKGERFFNESAPYQFEMNANMHQPEYVDIMIWNEKTMDQMKSFHTLGCSRVGWPGNKEVAERKEQNNKKIEEGLVQKANSIEELAEKLDIPKDQLVKTVKRYNELAHKGVDEDFGKEAFRMYPIEGAPYYGAWFRGVLLATLDGLTINDHMQVLDRNYNPIKGLYAAGNCSGGFFWGSYEDRIPGLTVSHAQTFGRLAGKYASINNA